MGHPRSASQEVSGRKKESAGDRRPSNSAGNTLPEHFALTQLMYLVASGKSSVWSVYSTKEDPNHDHT